MSDVSDSVPLLAHSNSPSSRSFRHSFQCLDLLRCIGQGRKISLFSTKRFGQPTLRIRPNLTVSCGWKCVEIDILVSSNLMPRLLCFRCTHKNAFHPPMITFCGILNDKVQSPSEPLLWPCTENASALWHRYEGMHWELTVSSRQSSKSTEMCIQTTELKSCRLPMCYLLTPFFHMIFSLSDSPSFL